jgi:predicted Zn-dependent protease
MVKLGYDPQEMLGMLGTMTDLETLQKARAAQMGAPRRTYHGIFSTHPRNDMRLRSAVAKAERLETSTPRDAGEAKYREMTEGLVWGENFKEKNDKPERYSDMSLRVRFDYPDGWTHTRDAMAKAVSGEPEDGAAKLSMNTHPRTPQEPEEYLYNFLNLSQLRDGQEIQPARLKGFTGILPGSGGKADQRVAVVFYKMNAFLFMGEVSEQDKFEEFDAQFLSSIATFRPISNRQIEGKKPTTIHYVKATSATTFAGLAQELKLDASETDDLRLINGYYPTGEPKPGEWIKIFKRE